VLRVVCAFDPDTGTELSRLSSTVRPNISQLFDVQMVNASRPEFVRLRALSQIDADRARYEVYEDHEPTLGNVSDGTVSTSLESSNEAS
jgi:hypothetical protein